MKDFILWLGATLFIGNCIADNLELTINSMRGEKRFTLDCCLKNLSTNVFCSNSMIVDSDAFEFCYPDGKKVLLMENDEVIMCDDDVRVLGPNMQTNILCEVEAVFPFSNATSLLYNVTTTLYATNNTKWLVIGSGNVDVGILHNKCIKEIYFMKYFGMNSEEVLSVLGPPDRVVECWSGSPMYPWRMDENLIHRLRNCEVVEWFYRRKEGDYFIWFEIEHDCDLVVFSDIFIPHKFCCRGLPIWSRLPTFIIR